MSKLVGNPLHSLRTVLLVKPSAEICSWTCMVDEQSTRQSLKVSLALTLVVAKKLAK